MVGGTIPVTLNKKTYNYPYNYGLGKCAAHDIDLPPTCVSERNGFTQPDWCANKWCYVDKDNCEGAKPSSYLPGRYYSFEFCGDDDTFSLGE